jgi:hypothetical protein
VLDIRRVYPENGFFKDKDLQEMMLRILFIYAREHEHILYKQVPQHRRPGGPEVRALRNG